LDHIHRRTPATRNIAISEEAYQALMAFKKPRESFTDAIIRTTGAGRVLDLAGTVSTTEAASIEKRVKRMRTQRPQQTHSTVDLAGRGSKHSKPTEMKRPQDKIRQEDARDDFEKQNEGIVIKLVRKAKRSWKQLCGLTPNRTGKPEWPTPVEIKNIWR
jgi:predicted CopG family antitoxin